MTTTSVRIGARPDVVKLTDSAVVKIRELLEQENTPGLNLRVAVRPGGCSGFSYDMIFDFPTSEDILKHYDGFYVVVDPESSSYLRGSILDYKDGLSDAGFKITNPNASRTCGCGNSFS